MDVESQHQQQQTKPSKKSLLLLILNLTLLVLGASITPLLLRLYFLHGGTRKWLSSWLQTAAFPLVLLPLSLSYKNRRKITITYPLFVASLVLGILIGFDDFLYAYGVSYLPVSTSSLLISTQLGFTALFAFFLVKQKFSPYSINAIALLSFGAVVLGIHSNGDRPAGESTRKYYIGFAMMVAAAGLYGLILPLVEKAYTMAKEGVTYALVMEMQFVMGMSATVFCTVGMAVNGDFQVK